MDRYGGSGNDALKLHEAAGWPDLTLQEWDAFVASCIAEVTLRNQDKLLDVGCGPGAFMMSVLKLHDVEISGVDISEDALRRCKRISPSGAYFQGDACEVLSRLESNSYDLVYTISVIQYMSLEETARLVEQMVRVSRSHVLVCDVIDEEKMANFHAFICEKMEVGETYRNKAIEGFSVYPKSFWKRFDGKIIENQPTSYVRGNHRYNVVITKEDKNA